MSEAPDLAENPEEVEDLPDEEYAYEALQHVLEEMTSVYHEDGEPMGVKLASMSAAPPDKDFVFVNPGLPEEMDPPVKGPNILRLVDDLLAHEVAHVNWSDLRSKEKFTGCYPGWGKIPGQVANILEDEYVDAKRKQQWYGMRSKLAYYVWLHMNTETRAPPIDEVYESEGRTQALMSALFQTALAGYIKGDTDAVPDDIIEFASYADPLIKRVRAEDDPDERFKLYHAMMQLLIRYAPDPDEFDPDKAESRSRESHDGGDGERGDGEPEPSPHAPEPEVDMPPETESALEEMLEEMMDDDDFPEPEPPEEGPEAPAPDPDEPESDDVAPDPDEGPEESASTDPDDSEEPDDEAGDGEEGESDEDGDGETTDAPDDEPGVVRDVESVLSDYDPRDLKVVN